MMDTAESTKIFTGGQASKMYGAADFFDQGTYGKVGRAGLQAIKTDSTAEARIRAKRFSVDSSCSVQFAALALAVWRSSPGSCSCIPHVSVLRRMQPKRTSEEAQGATRWSCTTAAKANMNSRDLDLWWTSHKASMICCGQATTR